MIFQNHVRSNKKSLDEKIEDGTYLGLTVICEDDCIRRVYNITNPIIQDRSQAWKKGLLIINEGDPIQPDGHWVTILALECALDKKPQPNKEQRKAFIRIASGITKVNLAAIHNSQKQGKLPFDFSE